MTEEIESVATLLARREYTRAVPLLERDLAKYPSNVRIRLQLADALAGAQRIPEAISQYEQTCTFYDENGLVVQAIAVRKKIERMEAETRATAGAESNVTAAHIPASPLFEMLTDEDRAAVTAEMILESRSEGDIIITEGEQGSSLYVIVSGSVKVFTRGSRGESLPLATLGAGEFFGEVSVLTGKPRTATITASEPTELLRLDKADLDRLREERPQIGKVLDDFYQKRALHTVEAMIENLKQGRG